MPNLVHVKHGCDTVHVVATFLCSVITWQSKIFIFVLYFLVIFSMLSTEFLVFTYFADTSLTVW